MLNSIGVGDINNIVKNKSDFLQYDILFLLSAKYELFCLVINNLNVM